MRKSTSAERDNSEVLLRVCDERSWTTAQTLYRITTFTTFALPTDRHTAPLTKVLSYTGALYSYLLVQELPKNLPSMTGRQQQPLNPNPSEWCILYNCFSLLCIPYLPHQNSCHSLTLQGMFGLKG